LAAPSGLPARRGDRTIVLGQVLALDAGETAPARLFVDGCSPVP
jgi:hypothetical protein